MSFTLGNDPEFFLVDKKGNPVPAFDTVGGTKQSPRVLPSGHTVQEDGCAVEIGIKPATTADEFAQHIKEAMSDVKAILKPLGLKPLIVSEVEFTQEQLVDSRGWQIGCDPDYSVYNKMKKNFHKDYTDCVRFAGGHLHIGSPFLLNPNNVERFIKLMDIAVGYKCATIDKFTRRSSVYGGAGKFRFKPYGVEYRTPSNIWLTSPALQKKIFEATRLCLEMAENNRHNLNYLIMAHNKAAVDGINTGTPFKALTREIEKLFYKQGN